jgi:hypothetical protein
MSARPTIVVSSLARYQTEFWIAVARELARRGFGVAVLSFDDPSTLMLREAGIRVFGPPHIRYEADPPSTDLESLNYWLSHERFVFGERDRRRLLSRLGAYRGLVDKALDELLTEGEVVLVQEVGGFLSVIASFFSARVRGVDNWFIEPAFFRGRLFFYKNTFAAPRVSGPLPARVSEEVKQYLAETIRTQSIVVPIKDRHQYRSAARKVLNVSNAKRLMEKLLAKYVRGQHMEFGHIGRHAWTHLAMVRNSIAMRRFYTPLADAGPFVYYPLHVPGDMALTLRSGEYLDQLALVDYLARTVPATHRVAVKEHPAMIGALDAARLRALLRTHDNVVVLPPETNNYEVLRATDVVVSVNSKSGAEAALLGKRVLVLGDAFYSDAPIVERVESLSALRRRLAEAVADPAAVAGADVVSRYFELVWQKSKPGELYGCNDENFRRFADSLIGAISVPVPAGD